MSNFPSSDALAEPLEIVNDEDTLFVLHQAMATRRNVQSEKTLAESQGGGDPSQRASDISPAVPASVVYKLLGFTFAMFCIPISSYFVTVNTVFKGNVTYAGGLAAVMANVVLIAYVIVAMKEDQSDRLEAEEKQRKGQ